MNKTLLFPVIGNIHTILIEAGFDVNSISLRDDGNSFGIDVSVPPFEWEIPVGDILKVLEPKYKMTKISLTEEVGANWVCMECVEA